MSLQYDLFVDCPLFDSHFISNSTCIDNDVHHAKYHEYHWNKFGHIHLDSKLKLCLTKTVEMLCLNLSQKLSNFIPEKYSAISILLAQKISIWERYEISDYSFLSILIQLLYDKVKNWFQRKLSFTGHFRLNNVSKTQMNSPRFSVCKLLKHFWTKQS